VLATESRKVAPFEFAILSLAFWVSNINVLFSTTMFLFASALLRYPLAERSRSVFVRLLFNRVHVHDNMKTRFPALVARDQNYLIGTQSICLSILFDPV